MSDEKLKKVKNHNGEEVAIRDADLEDGKPTSADNWRAKLVGRKHMLQYLETGERYWYSKNWYGSEKRKNPA